MVYYKININNKGVKMLEEKICGEILDHLKPYGVLDTSKTRKQLSVLPIYTVLPIYNNENKTIIAIMTIITVIRIVICFQRRHECTVKRFRPGVGL